MTRIDKTSAIFLQVLSAVAVFAWTNAQSSDSLGANDTSIMVVNSTEDIQFILPPPSTDILNILALPVGQGDCTFIQCPNGNVIVKDCGSSGGLRLTPAQIQNHFGPSIGRAVAIMITHPDRDHFNYLYQIQWDIQSIQAVIIGGTLQDYARFPDIHNWLVSFDTMGRLHTVNNGQPCIGTCTVPTGTSFCDNANIRFDILAANVGPSSNERSIVMKVSVSNGWSALLPGDMEGRAATAIATDPQVRPQLRSTVYKMAHHGASRLANQPDWLRPIQPRTAFASSGYNFGSCRHPRCETIRRIEALQSIAMGVSAHPFYCGNSGAPPTKYPQFTQSMYETTPCPDVLCILTYPSTGEVPPPNCRQVLQLPLENVRDDECPSDDEDEDFMNGKGSATMASYASLLTMAMLYCIFILF